MFDTFVTNAAFASRSWFAVFIWLIAFACGYYLYSVWQERNPVRMSFLRRVGLILMILSGTGLLIMLLRGAGVPVVAWPLWGYLVMLATVAYAAWAGWFYSQKLPALASTSSRQGGRPGAPAARQGARATTGGGARTYNAPVSSNGAPVRSEPRPVATTTRRESRRDRKRKSR